MPTPQWRAWPSTREARLPVVFKLFILNCLADYAQKMVLHRGWGGYPFDFKSLNPFLVRAEKKVHICAQDDSRWAIAQIEIADPCRRGSTLVLQFGVCGRRWSSLCAGHHLLRQDLNRSGAFRGVRRRSHFYRFPLHRHKGDRRGQQHVRIAPAPRRTDQLDLAQNSSL